MRKSVNRWGLGLAGLALVCAMGDVGLPEALASDSSWQGQWDVVLPGDNLLARAEYVLPAYRSAAGWQDLFIAQWR